MQPKNSNLFMLILFLTSIILAAVIGIVLELLRAFHGSAFVFNPPMWAVFLASQLLVFGVPCGIYMLIHRDKIKEILPLRRLGGLNVLMIIGMSLAVQPLFMLVNLLSQFLFPNVIAEAIGDVAQEGGFVIMLIIVAVVPSIFEELAFRGVGFAGFRHVKIRTAAVINGLIFGMIHMNMNQFIYAFALGALFCYFIYYTKSLWAPILAHFIFNGTQSLLLYAATALDAQYGAYAQYGMADAPMAEDQMMVFAIIFMAILAIVFTAGFIALFIAFRQHNIKRNDSDGIVTDTAAAYLAGGHPRPPAFTWAFWVVAGLFVALMIGNYLLPVIIDSLDVVAML